MMIKRAIINALPIILLISTIEAPLLPEEKKQPAKEEIHKTSMNWPDIDTAIMYEIQVTDVNYKLIQKKRVVKSEIEFSLPAGEYRVRIGTINKFHKIANWSDWAVFNVGGKPIAKKGEKMVFANSIKIGIGVPYFQMDPEYSKFLNNSFYGAILSIGGRIPTLIPFLHWNPLNYTGLEIEGTYIKFKGKKIPNRVTTNKIDILTGANLFFATDLSIPLNFIIRGGGGIVQTKFEYDTSLAEDLADYKERALTSVDSYYKAGASIEYSFIENFFLEAGADYYILRYISSDFKMIRYFCLAGIML